MKQKKHWLTSAVLVGVMLLFAGTTGYAQQTTDVEKTTGEPSWVRMMSDPKVNYFDAVNAYEAWLKEQQQEHSEAEAQNGEEREVYTTYRSKQSAFLYWKHEMFPFVQSDGSILSEKKRNRILRKIKH